MARSAMQHTQSRGCVSVFCNKLSCPVGSAHSLVEGDRGCCPEGSGDFVLLLQRQQQCNTARADVFRVLKRHALSGCLMASAHLQGESLRCCSTCLVCSSYVHRVLLLVCGQHTVLRQQGYLRLAWWMRVHSATLPQVLLCVFVVEV